MKTCKCSRVNRIGGAVSICSRGISNLKVNADTPKGQSQRTPRILKIDTLFCILVAGHESYKG